MTAVLRITNRELRIARAASKKSENVRRHSRHDQSKDFPSAAIAVFVHGVRVLMDRPSPFGGDTLSSDGTVRTLSDSKSLLQYCCNLSE